MKYPFVQIILAILVGSSTALSSTAPTVVSVSPLAQSKTAPINTHITITFDTPMDPQTIDSTSIMVFGRWSGVARGQFQIENNGTRIRFTPSSLFSVGEWVSVSLAKRIRSQSGQAMDHGYTWNFWIRTGIGSLSLTEVTRIPVRRPGESHIQSYGAYAGDLNSDGYTDLTIPNELSNDVRVFLNGGKGKDTTFVVHPLSGSSKPSISEGADFNQDGTIDIAVGSTGNERISVLLGDGAGGFSSITSYQASASVRGLSVMDLEGDGDMDIVTANRTGNNLTILKNNGDGTFAPGINMEANGNQETACAAADANGDGLLDLFVGAYASNEIILLLGDGNGGLAYSTKVSAGGKPWMIAVGDVNGDGNVDVVSANSVSNNAAVILGNGQGGLQGAVTYPVGNFPLAIELGDLDGDGDLDLVTSNFSDGNWTILENAGSGTFINPRFLQASTAGSCATLHDRDNDGDLDMTGIDEIDDLLFLFDNSPQVSVTENPQLPGEFKLMQNYPNPFNPTTIIKFALPHVGTRLAVSLRVFDLLGREVATLVHEELKPGTYEVTFDGHGFASSVYFYRLEAAKYRETKKLILLR